MADHTCGQCRHFSLHKGGRCDRYRYALGDSSHPGYLAHTGFGQDYSSGPCGGHAFEYAEFDLTVYSGPISKTAAADALDDIGCGGLDFDPPCADDLYKAAAYLANDLANEHLDKTWVPRSIRRELERAALWLARVAVTHSGQGDGS